MPFGSLQQSRERFATLLALRRDRHGDTHPQTLYAIGNLATCLRDLGELDGAEELALEECIGADFLRLRGVMSALDAVF